MTQTTAGASHGTVYALVDPRDGSTRYVGATTRPLAVRLNGHLGRAAKRVREWVAELQEAGLRPEIIALRQNVPVEELDEAEEAEITRMLVEGAALLNEVSVARGRRVTQKRAEHELKSVWNRFAVFVPGILGGPLPPGDVPLIEIPAPLWDFVDLLRTGRREQMAAPVEPGLPRETAAERWRIWGEWREAEERSEKYLKDSLRRYWRELRSVASDSLINGMEQAVCSVFFRPWPDRATAGRAVGLVPWFVAAVEPWRRLAELGGLALDDEPFIAWAARDSGTREALEFLSGCSGGLLTILANLTDTQGGPWMTGTGHLLAAVAASYSSVRPEERIHPVIVRCLRKLAEEHMTTEPMADLLLELSPGALDEVFGPDIAARIDRDLALPKGTSGLVLRALLERLPYVRDKNVRHAADRSAQQLQISALPDYATWTGPSVPAARTISACLVRVGLAAPDDCTETEYLAKVRELWLPSAEGALRPSAG